MLLCEQYGHKSLRKKTYRMSTIFSIKCKITWLTIGPKFEDLFIWKNWPPTGLFWVYFLSFQTNNFYKSKCEKCPSSTQCWDSNPRPSEHESPLITITPGPVHYINHNHINLAKNINYILALVMAGTIELLANRYRKLPFVCLFTLKRFQELNIKWIFYYKNECSVNFDAKILYPKDVLLVKRIL